MSLTFRLKRIGEINPPCGTPARIPRREEVALGETLRTSDFAGRIVWFSPGKRGVEGHELVGKDVDPYGVECLGHIKEKRACEPLLAKVPGDSFNEAGQLQGCAMFGSETKLLVTQ
jgi:hypothetical protein